MFPVYPRVWADPVYRADAEALLAECAARDVGVMAIKAVARRPWGEAERSMGTWYEPWTDAPSVSRGVAFALSTPGVHAFCTASDLGLLPLVLEAAETYSPLDDASRAAALDAVSGDDLIFPLAEKAKRLASP